MGIGTELSVRSTRYDYISVGDYYITLAAKEGHDGLSHLVVNGAVVTPSDFLLYVDSNPKYANAVIDMCLWMFDIRDYPERGLFIENVIRRTHGYYAPNEFSVQAMFSERCADLVDGDSVRVIQKINNPNHVPDVWLNVDGEEVPVEVKVGKFNQSALKQLQRYIDFYGCKRGVAVGNILTVELPSNIKFIPTESFVSRELVKLPEGRKVSLGLLLNVANSVIEKADVDENFLPLNVHCKIEQSDEALENALAEFLSWGYNGDPYFKECNDVIDSIVPVLVKLGLDRRTILRECASVQTMYFANYDDDDEDC